MFPSSHSRVFSNQFVQNSVSEAFNNGVAPPPNEALQEMEAAQGHSRNRTECLSPNRKRPRTGEMAASAKQRGNAAATSCGSLERHGGSNGEEDSNPSLLTSSALMGSSPAQEVVQEEVPGQITSGWKVRFAT
jgi:hypothetical protein